MYQFNTLYFLQQGSTLIRRCKLDLEMLYSDQLANWKKPGILALICGLVAGAIFYNFAFFVAFPVSGIAYYIFAKSMKT